MSTWPEALAEAPRPRCDAEGCCLHELPEGHPDAPGRSCCWCGTPFTTPTEHGQWATVDLDPAWEAALVAHLAEAEREPLVAQATIALEHAAWSHEGGQASLLALHRAALALARAHGYVLLPVPVPVEPVEVLLFPKPVAP